jgi:hypothetical protein
MQKQDVFDRAFGRCTEIMLGIDALQLERSPLLIAVAVRMNADHVITADRVGMFMTRDMSS